MVSYIPQRGDIVWLDFHPQAGKEIKKRRPALVVSPKEYNQKTGLALFLPLTSQIKGYPFEALLNVSSIDGAVLCDQMRSLDWKNRHAVFITELPPMKVLEIIEKFKILIDV
jgi:mRNA interferase MazF